MTHRVLLCLLLFCLPAAAEQRVEQDGYIVHYAALRTTDLTPEVARQFDVRRRGKQALLVLNAQRLEGGRAVPVPATATGRVTSLLGHLQKLDLRPVQEGPVHYVLAEFETLNREYLTVDVQLTPAGAARPIQIKFQQQFFND